MNLSDIQSKISILTLLYFSYIYSSFVIPLVLGFMLGSLFQFYLGFHYGLSKDILINLFVKYFNGNMKLPDTLLSTKPQSGESSS